MRSCHAHAKAGISALSQGLHAGGQAVLHLPDQGSDSRCPGAKHLGWQLPADALEHRRQRAGQLLPVLHTWRGRWATQRTSTALHREHRTRVPHLNVAQLLVRDPCEMPVEGEEKVLQARHQVCGLCSTAVRRSVQRCGQHAKGQLHACLRAAAACCAGANAS